MSFKEVPSLDHFIESQRQERLQREAAARLAKAEMWHSTLRGSFTPASYEPMAYVNDRRALVDIIETDAKMVVGRLASMGLLPPKIADAEVPTRSVFGNTRSRTRTIFGWIVAAYDYTNVGMVRHAMIRDERYHDDTLTSISRVFLARDGGIGALSISEQTCEYAWSGPNRAQPIRRGVVKPFDEFTMPDVLKFPTGLHQNSYGTSEQFLAGWRASLAQLVDSVAC